MASNTMYISGGAAAARPDLRFVEGLVISPPAPYRCLDDGYTAVEVAPWAEHRQCLLTGNNSLYALKPFKAGEVLRDFSYKMVLDSPNYLTVQVADTKHIMLNPEWLQYINHSCDPNVFFNTATFQLEALREIKVGDELGFFYPSTEWLMESPFKCCCGSKACISYIAGAAKLSSEETARYRLTEFITQKLNSVANSPAGSP